MEIFDWKGDSTPKPCVKGPLSLQMLWGLSKGSDRREQKRVQ